MVLAVVKPPPTPSNVGEMMDTTKSLASYKEINIPKLPPEISLPVLLTITVLLSVGEAIRPVSSSMLLQVVASPKSRLVVNMPALLVPMEALSVGEMIRPHKCPIPLTI